MKFATTVPGRIALLSCIFLFAACSKLTADNYARIKSGMEYKEVTNILGTPARCDDVAGFKSCTWGDAKTNVTVRFAGDKVILHSAENIR
jgi:outer membrane protein assembly factor BamE (lipoprotein component of BamABCDE complex)